MLSLIMGLGVIGFILYMFYDVFVSDYIDSIKARFKAKSKAETEQKIRISNMSKITTVKMLSNSTKDIEKFITENAEYLSNNQVEQLAGRIQELQAIDVIRENDESLKRKIDSL